MVANHFLEHHKEDYTFTELNKLGVMTKKVIRAIFADLLAMAIFPFSLTVSVLFKIFEWLNDRIGVFD